MAPVEHPSALGDLVFTPASPEKTRIEAFRRSIAARYNVELPDYPAFWRWSCQNPVSFWKECWEEVDIIASKIGDYVLDSNAKMYPPPQWFQGARLNVAENWLRHSLPSSKLLDSTALIQACEADTSSPNDFFVTTTTQRELRSQVACAVHALRKRGVTVGDRVGSYSSNCTANVVALLATAAIGAVWVSSAADFAPQGVLERMETVRPKVLFGVDGVRYNGRIHDHIGKVAEVVRGLHASHTADQQALEAVIIVPYMSQIGGGSSTSGSSTNSKADDDWIAWEDLLHEGIEKERGDIDFEQLDFNHPLWILFSSGTTGKPKAIQHRAGGMLLQLAKEHLLHGGMTSKDVFFQYTTPGWMMFNFLVGGLISGAPLVLFDGSPLRPASTLWALADQLGITVFGTSAAYIAALEKSGFEPRKVYPNLKVTQILSTGSPLRADLYSFVNIAIGENILVGSITGGTDICSLFAGHNVALPVYAGEIQARNLGMNVDVFDDSGNSILPGEGSGDLVCKTPFPAQPLCFFGKDTETRHFETYYSQFPNVWYHGDYVAISRHEGLVMLGRSDGILNPSGIRFGSSEIYEVLEDRKAGDDILGQISHSLVCSLKTPKGDDEVVVLFLVLKGVISEEAWLELQNTVKKSIREKRSARHVPAYIVQIEGVPLTLNGKLAEVPAKKIINGTPLSNINRATLQNPSILEAYVKAGEHLRNQMS
ncbi:hypothetical protein CBS101457_002364 [Exobasidium rhododendri]|nr:hypothetical protein CBS101457_002364 [Exobasidium rhododendri]